MFSDFSSDGFVVAAGPYTVRLTANGKSLTQPLLIAADPRIAASATAASAADRRAHEAIARQLYDRVNEIVDAVTTVREVRTQVLERRDRAAGESNGPEIRTVGTALTGALTLAETTLVQPKWKTFQDVVNFSPKLLSQVGYTFRVHEGGEGPATSGVTSRAADLEVAWQTQRVILQKLLDEDLASYNALFRGAGIPAVIVPKKRLPPTVVP